MLRAQAEESKSYDTALSKLEELASHLGVWREALTAAKKESESPSEPEAAPEPPAEKVDFFVNSTYVPEKCPRKSEDGAVMKVHYVGRLIHGDIAGPFRRSYFGGLTPRS